MQLYYSKRKDRIFNALLCLYLFYYSYRYIFRYNSSTTSPTYSDTPMLFQLGKYALLVLLIVILIFQTKWTVRIKGKKSQRRTLIAIIFLVLQFTVYGLLTKNMDALAFALILVPPIFFLLNPRKICIEHVEKVLFVFWWFSFICELIQIALYIRTGRLPALAYPTGKITDVRFGGAWDDPNGYSLLMIFYIFYFLFKYKGIKQIAYLGATLLMLLLTWSGTGYIAFVATALIILMVRLRDSQLIKKYLYYGVLAIVVLGAVVLMKRASIVDTLAYYFETKSGSVAQHQSGWELSNLSIFTILGVAPKYLHTEAGLIRLISIGGMPALLAFFVIANGSCKQVKTLLKGKTINKAILYGILAYIIGFVLFNVNLPHFMSFYCMGLLSCFVSLPPSLVRTSGFGEAVKTIEK